MRRIALLALTLTFLSSAGCRENKFKIEMKINDNGQVLRNLSIWTADQGKILTPDMEISDQALSVYHVTQPSEDEILHYSGTFDEILPADLSYGGLKNNGFIRTETCPLGNVYTYIERMPGRTDLTRIIAEGQELVDTLVKSWVAWAGRKDDLRTEPERLAKLTAFLENDLRDDAMTLLLMGWQAMTRQTVMQDIEDCASETNTISDRFEKTEEMRFTQFLVERGYLRASEGLDLDSDFSTHLIEGVIRRAAAAMGYGEQDALPSSLARLRDPDVLEQTAEEALKAVDVETEELEKKIEALMGDWLGDRTSGEVIWTDVDQPLETNGHWQPEQRAIVWEAEGRQGCQPPQILYATWPKTNLEFQQKHFGRVMLEGERLRKYIPWRSALSEGERAEWDRFIDGLTPELDVVEQLKAFRFSAENAETSAQTENGEKHGSPTPGAALIIDAPE